MFKKLSLVCALALGLSANTGLFVGVNAGVPITTPEYGGQITSIASTFPTSGVGYTLGVNVGYKSELATNQGLRYYIWYSFSQSYGKKSGNKATIDSNLITLNADYYYNFSDYFGVYAGLGVGYVTYKPEYSVNAGQSMTIGGSTKGGFALPLNLGFIFSDASQRHGIVLGAKIPLLGYEYDVNAMGGAMSGTVELRDYIVHVGYNYTF